MRRFSMESENQTLKRMPIFVSEEKSFFRMSLTTLTGCRKVNYQSVKTYV